MRTLAFVHGLFLLSCASSTGAPPMTFPASALARVETAELRVELRTAPAQPPVRGNIASELTITDARGAPIDGLALEVVPWMPAHGHGSSSPEVTPLAGGKYRMDRVSLPMPGKWELRVQVVGALQTRVVVPLDVQ